MKFRRGFVSNSSSSSFILALPSLPKSAEELRAWLFGDIAYLSHPYEIRAVPALQAANSVFEQITETDSHLETAERVADLVQAPHSFECYRRDRKRYDKKANEYETKTAKEFVESNKGKSFFLVTYSDETPFGSFMEHGGIFNNIPHIEINNH
jgi:hypothetical protein